LSIASEIARLQTAKADIKAAIEDKGVTVPSAATLDDFADLVEAIQTGGGGGGGGVSGTFTPASDLRSITLPDTIGKSSILIYPMFDIATADITNRVHWGALISNGECIMVASTNNGKTGYVFMGVMASATGHTSTRDSFSSTTGTVTINGGADSNYGGYYISGKQYGYIAW
jgi:hypothetical protein